MTKYQWKLTAIAFGLFEISLGCILASFIWIETLLGGARQPSIIINVVLMCILIITIWQVFHRKKAITYLVGLASRVFFISSVFTLWQIGVITVEKQALPSNYYWLFITIAIGVFSVIQHMLLEKKAWSKTLKIWEKIGKINLERSYFKIVEMFHGDSITVSKMESIVLIGLVASGVFRSLVVQESIKNTIFHLGPVGMVYFGGMFIGKIIAWISELAKIQKTNRVEFVTEYGLPKISEMSQSGTGHQKLSREKRRNKK